MSELAKEMSELAKVGEALHNFYKDHPIRDSHADPPQRKKKIYIFTMPAGSDENRIQEIRKMIEESGDSAIFLPKYGAVDWDVQVIE